MDPMPQMHSRLSTLEGEGCVLGFTVNVKPCMPDGQVRGDEATAEAAETGKACYVPLRKCNRHSHYRISWVD